MTDPPERVRVALIDDHAMVRQALAAVLGDGDRIEIVAQGESASDALEILKREAVDVLVLDYNMPGGGALLVLEELERSHSRVRSLVLTVHESPHYAIRVLEAGAMGFLVKSSAVEALQDAILAVERGDISISPAISREVIHRLRQPKRSRIGIDALSAREFELLRLLGSGQGLKEAALQLEVSVSTASTYRSRILGKLNLGSTAELIHFAIEHGLTA